ncbi:hypothetical protein SNE40_015178 [Patella caerulea]|uniref:Uncharacterized protein n=1 Tax=Patella caerulea TaxID=87958 RepID=A0AAN8PE99_PATCE
MLVCRCKDGCDEEFRCLTGGCLPGWSGNTCQRENVALDGQATQTPSNFDEITLCSSSESTMPCEAANAIDGIQSTTFNASTCSLPGILDDVMVWEVRFKQSVVVNWLDVYFGIDVLINQSLPTDFLVFVDKHRCYMDIVRTSSGMYSIQCPEPVKGKTLSFHAKSTIVPILSLCEIEIFKCADGWYSEFCDKRCNCYGDICDTVNGMCFYGCPNGYHGQDCLEPCSEGTWGLNCETSCENCAAGCDRFTGYCNTSDCEPFWYSGPRCDVCPPGYYGNNCTELCRNCGGNGTCSIYGMCNDGCVPRYQEPFCRECETGKWGPMCDQTCGQCVTKSCDQTSGLCDELGCRPNWKGGKCDGNAIFDVVLL